MQQLTGTEVSIVELLSIRPLSYFPPIHHTAVTRLIDLGVVGKQDGYWYLTQQGLALSGRTTH